VTLFLPLASAAPILSTRAIVSSIGANGPVTNYCFTTGPCNGTSTVLPASGAFGGTFLNYAASGIADYGVLKVGASGTLSVPQPAAISSSINAVAVNSIASFRDQWTLSGPATTGTYGLQLGFILDGSFASTSSAFANASFRAQDFTLGLIAPTVGVTTPGVYYVTIPVPAGVLFDFEVDLQASAVLNQISSGGFNGESATVNLLNTARLSSITLLDHGGPPVPFTFTTASGSPNFNVTATPEPGSLALLAAGLLGLAAKRARKGRWFVARRNRSAVLRRTSK
jgi:hypothetical protein